MKTKMKNDVRILNICSKINATNLKKGYSQIQIILIIYIL